MSRANTDRQIVAGLDQIHRELITSTPCRWSYTGTTDTYTCPHLTLTGKEVITRVERFNYYPLRRE